MRKDTIMADTITTHVFGKKEDLNSALTEGKINEFDEVFLTDTDELAYVNENKELKYVVPKTQNDIEVTDAFGKLVAGDTIPAGSSFEDVLNYMMKGIGTPKYTAPNILIHNDGTGGGTYEAGTMISPVISITWNQNDAGDMTHLEILKNGVSIDDIDASFDGSDPSGYSYAPAAEALPDSGLSFNAKVTYNEGPIKTDNAGKPVPEGHIEAGTVIGSNIGFIARRKTFWTSNDGSSSLTFTSDAIRAWANSELGIANGDKTITFPNNSRYIAIALPASKKITAVKSDQLPSLTVDNFAKSDTQVADARGGDNGLMDYTAYMYIALGTASDDITITFTIADA